MAPTTDSQMYQTMHRQPAEIRRLVTDGWMQAAQAADLVGTSERVFLVGIGTSYHAALVSSWLLRAAGIDVRAVNSFDFAGYPETFPLAVDDVVIVMAHTGTTTSSARSLERAAGAGATVLSVGSHSAEHPGSLLVLRTVEPEQSAAYTASHLAAMTVLAQVATEIGERREAIGVEGFRDALLALPDQIAEVLSRQGQITPVARDAVGRRVYATAAGPNEATALELVIKAREAAHAWIDALAAEQFLHGPMVAVNAGDLAVLIRVPGAAADRLAEIAAVLDAIGAALWVVGEPIERVPSARSFPLPALPEILSPLLTVVPMQMLAYEMAVQKGLDPDTFRLDDPRYAAAFGLLAL